MSTTTASWPVEPAWRGPFGGPDPQRPAACCSLRRNGSTTTPGLSSSSPTAITPDPVAPTSSPGSRSCPATLRFGPRSVPGGPARLSGRTRVRAPTVLVGGRLAGFEAPVEARRPLPRRARPSTSCRSSSSPIAAAYSPAACRLPSAATGGLRDVLDAAYQGGATSRELTKTPDADAFFVSAYSASSRGLSNDTVRRGLKAGRADLERCAGPALARRRRLCRCEYVEARDDCVAARRRPAPTRHLLRIGG